MTRARLNRIVKLAGAGMVLCWFDALNTLVMPALDRSSIPVPVVALILLWSSTMAAIVKSWSLRIVRIIGFHVIGYLAALALVLQYSGDPAYGLLDFTWMTQGPTFAWIVWQWLIFFINALWTGLLYYLGYDLQTYKIRMLPVSLRLDIGISVLFVALIAKLIAEQKGVVIPYEHTMGYHLASFMILGLFSIGLVRNQASHHNSIVTYSKGAGIALSFGLLVIVFGTTVVMLFLPDLIKGALWSKDMLNHSWQYFENATRFLANLGSINHQVISKTGGNSGGNSGGVLIQGGPDPFYLKLVFALGICFGLVVLWFIGWFIVEWLLMKVKWLLMKPEPGRKKPGPWIVLQIMARRLKRMALRIIRFFNFKRDPLHRVEHYYRRLQIWGSRSGLPRNANETPNEYGSRLAADFQGLTDEIRFLVDMFNITRFRETAPQAEQFRQVQTNWKRLCSPKLWPLRVRLWLFKARM